MILRRYRRSKRAFEKKEDEYSGILSLLKDIAYFLEYGKLDAYKRDDFLSERILRGFLGWESTIHKKKDFVV